MPDDLCGVTPFAIAAKLLKSRQIGEYNHLPRFTSTQGFHYYAMLALAIWLSNRFDCPPK
jgi:hypothetical protein